MKKGQRYILILGMFLTTLSGRGLMAEKITRLENIIKPETLHVTEGKAYIVEREKIHILLPDTGKVLKSFGKKGEGPGEFKRMPHFKIYPDYLLVTSMGKMMFFSHDGEYLREQKHTFHHHGGALPVGDKIVGKKTGTAGKDGLVSQSFGIYDQQLNHIKTIYNAPNPNMLEIRDTEGKSPYKLIKDTIRCDTYKDHVFIADSRKGLFFKVFYETGKWLYDINVDCQPKKISQAYKEKALAKLFKESWWPQFENRMEPTFPKFFPQIRGFTIVNDNLFVITFIERENLVLLKAFDLKGKPLGEAWVPLAMDGSRSLYSIYNNTYYYLLDDDDEEIWEFHKTNLEFDN